jgi:hypothetical protein
VVTQPEVPESAVVIDPSLLSSPPTGVEPSSPGAALPTGQRPTKPGAKALDDGEKAKAPVVAPLPAALKNKPPPAEVTGETSRTRISGSTVKWLVLPLLVLLGVAAFIVYGIIEEQADAMSEDNNRPGRLKRQGEGKSREVAPVKQADDDDLAAPGPSQNPKSEPPPPAEKQPEPAPSP